MRKWLKVGIISLVSTVAISTSLVFASKMYFDSKHQTTQQPSPDTNNNNQPINPNPSPDNSSPKPNDDPIIQPDNNQDVDSPTTPDSPNDLVPDDKPIIKPPQDSNPEQAPDNNSSDKPNNPQPEQNTPPATNENNATNFNLQNSFSKYEFVKLTTDYQDYFTNNKQLLFIEAKVKSAIFNLLNNAIIKSMNIDLNKTILNTNIYYQLANDSKTVKLKINWTIKNTNSSLNLEKKYYDNIYISLKRV